MLVRAAFKMCVCLTAAECWSRDGSSYTGHVSESYSGRQCLKWNSRRYSNRIGDHNYCR